MTELRDYQPPKFCNKMSKAGCFLGGVGGGGNGHWIIFFAP